jgi:hypothetical protein
VRRNVLARLALSALLVTACDVATSSETATGSVGPSVSLAPATLPPHGVLKSWTQADLPIAVPGIFGGNSPNALTVFGDTLVAAGSVNGGCCDGGFSTNTRALVWTSEDGREWDLVPGGPVFALGMPVAVAATKTDVVAVGTVNREGSVPGEVDRAPAVWTSRDARSWARVEHAPPFVDVAAVASGFVGVAQVDAGPEVWASSDGRAWHRIADAAALGPGQAGRIEATELGLVIVGRSPEFAGPAIWRSPDGLRWTRAADALEATGLFGVEGVAAIEGRLVAIASSDDGPPAVLVSDDELRWRHVEGMPVTPSGRFDVLVAGADLLLVIGADVPHGAEGPEMVAAAWASADGLAWARLDTAAPVFGQIQEIADAAAFLDGFVVVGRAAAHDAVETFQPAAWVVR